MKSDRRPPLFLFHRAFFRRVALRRDHEYKNGFDGAKPSNHPMDDGILGIIRILAIIVAVAIVYWWQQKTKQSRTRNILNSGFARGAAVPSAQPPRSSPQLPSA